MTPPLVEGSAFQVAWWASLALSFPLAVVVGRYRASLWSAVVVKLRLDSQPALQIITSRYPSCLRAMMTLATTSGLE